MTDTHRSAPAPEGMDLWLDAHGEPIQWETNWLTVDGERR